MGETRDYQLGRLKSFKRKPCQPPISLRGSPKHLYDPDYTQPHPLGFMLNQGNIQVYRTAGVQRAHHSRTQILLTCGLVRF